MDHLSTDLSSDVEDLLAGREWGRICALAGECQRDLAECADSYGGLFLARPFDPALFGTLAFACAFGGPWLTPDQLRVAARTCLWCFGLDWLVDYVATTPGEVDGIVRRCLAVAGGAAPGPDDELTRFLADIRDDLSAAGTFPALHPIWYDELRRMLTAMARERDWRSAGDARPTFDEYLHNADNLGFSFVYVSHWFLAGEPVPAERVGELRAAGWEVQRVIRLLNDLGTYERDVTWGDLNALMLGVTRSDVSRRVAALTDHCRELIRPLRVEHPKLTVYLSRQIGFNMGFYRIGDYWGTL
ncbi:MAG: hypothetical protein AUI14_16015 [Actinobacteria bacterium 13_2_20CM_2_71_6]|nr:MAG: hypothetical protein AUI14_16015 [Actinobacteria bacterium 13_2_20CM_2_71_6]